MLRVAITMTFYVALRYNLCEKLCWYDFQVPCRYNGVAERHIKSLFVVVCIRTVDFNVNSGKTPDFWRHKLLQWYDFSCGALLQRYFAADTTFPNHATSKVIKR
jgi:hypothetical protein